MLVQLVHEPPWLSWLPWLQFTLCRLCWKLCWPKLQVYRVDIGYLVGVPTVSFRVLWLLTSHLKSILTIDCTLTTVAVVTTEYMGVTPPPRPLLPYDWKFSWVQSFAKRIKICVSEIFATFNFCGHWFRNLLRLECVSRIRESSHLGSSFTLRLDMGNKISRFYFLQIALYLQRMQK